MSLVLHIQTILDASNRGTNVIKASFRDHTQTRDFQPGNAFSEVRLNKKFEWPIARLIEPSEEILLTLFYKQIKTVQYGLLRVNLHTLVRTGRQSLTESFKDERHNLIKAKVQMALYYTSPDRRIGAEWAKESLEEPLFSDTKSYLDDVSESLEHLEAAINPSGSKISLISGGMNVPDSPEKSPKGNRLFKAIFKRKSGAAALKIRNEISDQYESKELLSANADDNSPEVFSALNEGSTKDTSHAEVISQTKSAMRTDSTSSDGYTVTQSVTPRTRHSFQAEAYRLGHKLQDFQVCVTIIEARQLSGLNMDPCVCIQVGDQKKYTSVKESTNCPYYSEYFVFDFRLAPDVFYDQIILLTVFQSRKLLRSNEIIGTFKLDVGTVYAQPDHQFYHKWALLTDSEDLMSGPKGYVKCNLSVSGKGEPAKMPPKLQKDEDDIEANLLLPAGIEQDRQRARYTVKIYRADGLPSMSTGVVANVKRVITGDATKDLLEPFVEVTFAGHTAKTSIKKGTSKPVWNEAVVFTEMFPPLVRRMKLQVKDASFNGDVLATHFVDFSTISDEGRRGFLPTFGPSYVNLYGSTRDANLLGDKGADLNCGLGEGVAYRGRLLISFKVELLDTNFPATTETTVEPCLAVAESVLGKKEEFFLFCCIMDVSMLDKKLSDKPLQIEMSFGNLGNSLDNVESIENDIDGGEESGIKYPKGHGVTVTPPIKPTSRDQEYNYLPLGKTKPCLYIKEVIADQRRRLYNVNALTKLAESLCQSLEQTEDAIERELPFAEQQLKLVLDQFANDCGSYLNIIRTLAGQNSGQNKLDKERFRMCQREIDHMASFARNLRSGLTKTNAQEKLRQAYHYVDTIRRIAREPQHSFPDVFIWVISGSKRIAYQRFPIEDLVFSPIAEQRGKLCGSVHSVFLKLPGRKNDTGMIVGQSTLYFYFCLNKQKAGFITGLPKGYDLTKELSDAEHSNADPPANINFTEVVQYQLRCHIYQARSLIGSDDTGLSDPYAKVIFDGYSATTQVIEQTLNPMWDECLVLPNLELFGSPIDLQLHPPSVVIQLFDQDPAGKSEYIGQALAPTVVKLFSEPYEKPKFPPKLCWFPIHRGTERGGELLAAFELLQLSDNGSNNSFPDSTFSSRVGPRGPILPVPEGIRPKLIRYRIEVLFWGLRDLKRIQLQSVDKPRIDVECAGKILSSSIIQNYKKNPNFTQLVQNFDVDLPDDPVYWPPITIRCVECKNFGRFVLIGTHTISAINKYMYHIPEKETIAKRSQSITNENVIIHIDGEPAVVSADGQISSDTLFRKNMSSPSLARKRGVAEEFETFDWWSKYFASVERMITEHKGPGSETTSPEVLPKKSTHSGNANSTNRFISAVQAVRFANSVSSGPDGSLKSEKQIAARKKSRTSDKISRMKAFDNVAFAMDESPGKSVFHRDKKTKLATFMIYQTELESVADFEGFDDWLCTFELFRGKHTFEETNDEARRVGRFKGSLKICRHPIPTDCQKTFFKHIASNEPMTVLVRVYIVKANELHPADINGKADPYVYIQLGRTKINDKENYISKQLNPVFGKCFEIETVFPFENLLTIQVYDWDLVGMDDLIGETKIDLENRFYSYHRATCGIPEKYETSGYNIWRDPMRPSQILAKLCKDYHIDGPFYMPGQVRVGGKCFLVPPDDDKTSSSSKVDCEPLALYALHHWHEVPKVGCHLVPEHVETRSLYHPDKPGIEQGRLEMWVDMFPLDMPGPGPPVDISPRKPKSYELRVVIWNTDDVVLEDDAFFTGEKMSDIYVKGWLKGPEDMQATDIHYRSLTGEGNFNWRFVFPFDYLEAEEKIVTSRKESLFSWDETEFKVPARLQLQVWDADHFSADDFLGSLTIDLNRFPRGAKTSKHCRLNMLDPNSDNPVVNIFKQKRIKGWWPFQAKNIDGELELTGKVEAEIHLLTAEEAEKCPVGLGRNEPEPLEKPNRPDSSFMWFLNPLKSIRYILWHNYKWIIVKLLVLLLFVLLIILFIYSLPGYMVKKMLNA